MESRFDTFKANAHQITALRQQQQELSQTNLRLQTSYTNLLPAYNYMKLLIRTVKNNPGLIEEWEHFLQTAGMPEPEWKDEYAVDRFKVD